ncbi:MAG TPA: type II toxin-antitoxin system Phd/YefM family antitoxin [Pseudonocardia sp.]|jgi:prevent-host-death family protein|uniref:type II toxin-antitoxin system Phd/YefM family antitoxin n=1 Tax=Pseudonocardia sp. TaxID=60912 RepID=UPI002F42F2B4
MKEMSATEVARNFSAVLDSIEDGETVVITRAGSQVAKLVPTPRANGAALAEVLRSWQGHPALDEQWAANMAEARKLMNASAELDRDPWQD